MEQCEDAKCMDKGHEMNVNGEHVKCDSCGGKFWSDNAFMTPIGAWCNKCKMAEME